MKSVQLPGGPPLPAVGQGTWSFGQDRSRRAQEVAALQLGISLGMTLIDTAEYYAAGGAEEVVGDALEGLGQRVFVVTKVWPSNAGYREAIASVRGSLNRLRLQRLDAVLLHWPTRSVPLRETLRAFRDLMRDGVLGRYGVSNFDESWLLRAAEAADAESLALPSFNQVPYSLRRRGVEHRIVPYAAANGQVVMAYSPLGHGRMASWPGFSALRAVADRRGCSPAQAALAFLRAQGPVVPIPKAVSPDHVRANAAAGGLELDADDLDRLKAAFPRAAGAGLLHIPPYAPVFRLIMWAERRQHGEGSRAV